MKKILVVAAHPDDEVLGCGATLAAAIRAGAHAKVLILAQGITARYDAVDDEVAAEVQRLYESARAANGILGVKPDDVIFGDFPCMGMNAQPFIAIVQTVKKVVQAYKPDVVYTHHPGDYNVDHRVAFDAAVFATRPCPGEHYPRRVYSFEVPSSTEWAWQAREPFAPAVFVDVEATIDRKIEAMNAYASEVRAYPHPRSPEALRIIAQKRGLDAGLRYAEAFQLIRAIQDAKEISL